jgi:hypothetical protein
MRGWRRIGVVLSVLWFVGFGAWLWISSISEHNAFYRLQLHNCADSEARRPVIPTESGHPIRRKAATDSDRRRPPVDRVSWGTLPAI